MIPQVEKLSPKKYLSAKDMTIFCKKRHLLTIDLSFVTDNYPFTKS